MNFEASNNLAGRPLTKQVSLSLITPQTLTGYTEFFRQNSHREDGWISVKIGHSDAWVNKWFIFDEGVLKYGPHPSSAEGEFVCIPLQNVIKLRADGDATILVSTTTQKILLRLATTDEMHKWLFCFQKSVAMVLTHLMSLAYNPSSGTGASGQPHSNNHNHHDKHNQQQQQTGINKPLYSPRMGAAAVASAAALHSRPAVGGVDIHSGRRGSGSAAVDGSLGLELGRKNTVERHSDQISSNTTSNNNANQARASSNSNSNSPYHSPSLPSPASPEHNNYNNKSTSSAHDRGITAHSASAAAADNDDDIPNVPWGGDVKVEGGANIHGLSPSQSHDAHTHSPSIMISRQQRQQQQQQQQQQTSSPAIPIGGRAAARMGAAGAAASGGGTGYGYDGYVGGAGNTSRSVGAYDAYMLQQTSSAAAVRLGMGIGARTGSDTVSAVHHHQQQQQQFPCAGGGGGGGGGEEEDDFNTVFNASTRVEEKIATSYCEDDDDDDDDDVGGGGGFVENTAAGGRRRNSGQTPRLSLQKLLQHTMLGNDEENEETRAGAGLVYGDSDEEENDFENQSIASDNDDDADFDCSGYTNCRFLLLICMPC